MPHLYVTCNFSYDAKEEFDDVDVVLRFLQQLHVTFNDNGTSTMASCKTAIEKFGRSTRNKLFFVRCDIQDAFGSIKQGIIYLRFIRFIIEQMTFTNKLYLFYSSQISCTILLKHSGKNYRVTLQCGLILYQKIKRRTTIVK